MSKKDFSKLEDEIMSAVNNAFRALDLVNFKIDVNNKTNNHIKKIKSNFGRCSVKYVSMNKKDNKDILSYISKRPVGSISGVFYILFGVIGVLISFFSTIVFLIFEILFIKVGIDGNYYIIFGVLLILFIISLVSLVKGISLRKRVKRFKMYLRFINNESYFLIKDLARFYKEKESFVVKDLSKMIDLGMFLEGHIDEEKTYFIINDKIYSEYLNLKKQQILKDINNKKEDEQTSNSKNEIVSIVNIGRNYISQIKKIKNELYRENIALEVDKLVSIADKILYQVEKNPNKIREVNKFINHYLPITIKLINSYKEINNEFVKNNNVENAKNEIEKSINLINNAFENLLEDLFEDVVLDISTDISVLKTLFKQEGLTEDNFES